MRQAPLGLDSPRGADGEPGRLGPCRREQGGPAGTGATEDHETAAAPVPGIPERAAQDRQFAVTSAQSHLADSIGAHAVIVTDARHGREGIETGNSPAHRFLRQEHARP
ncbi:hypothetical protein GCM10027445_37420 [Amycolatopsis endophytica]